MTPRAGRSVVAGVHDDVLLVKLAAAPVDGAANDTLVSLLAHAFDLPPRNVQIASGHRSRTKRVVVAGTTAADLEQRLAELLA